MKYLILCLFAILNVSAQALPNLGWGSLNAGYNWFGPKNCYPGFTCYFAFPQHMWRVPVTCSATGNTCDAAGSGYTPTGNETGVIVTASTVPTGMDIQSTTYIATYKICNVSGTQFQLGQLTSCGTIETFTSAGSGVSILLPNSVVGSTTTYCIHCGTAADIGFPSGTTIKWGTFASSLGWLQTVNASANSNIPNTSHGNQLIMKATIPANATPGDYTISLVNCTADTAGGTCGGTSDTLSFTVTVPALTFISDAAGPTSFPAIPGLATWSSTLTNGIFGSGIGSSYGAGRYCNTSTGQVINNNGGSNVLYPGDQFNSIPFYDGQLSLFRMSKYLNTSGWDLCANTIGVQGGWGNADSTGSPNIIHQYGQLNSFATFPTGFKYMINDDPRYISVVQAFRGMTLKGNGGPGGAVYGVNGCNASDFLQRDDAYGLDALIAARDLGFITQTGFNGNDVENNDNNVMQRCVDELIGMIDAQTNGTGRYQELQWYTVGLAMHALIHWWQMTHDPRIPILAKTVADQYYAVYNTSTHIARWWNDPNGIRCATATNWYIPPAGVAAVCGASTNIAANDLINLISFVYAWYWRLTGDDTYRTEGDDLFSHSFDNNVGGTWASEGGKVWSQAYRYSFDYVGWRAGWLPPDKSVE